MYESIYALMALSMGFLALVLPIILAFTNKARWVSQFFMFVMYLLLLREYTIELYFICDVSNKISAGIGLGIIMFQTYVVTVLAIFILNIIIFYIISFYKKKYTIYFIDMVFLILFILTPFYINSVSVNLHYEGGCSQLETLGRILFIL
jgi:hypothetical protein